MGRKPPKKKAHTPREQVPDFEADSLLRAIASVSRIFANGELPPLNAVPVSDSREPVEHYRVEVGSEEAVRVK